MASPQERSPTDTIGSIGSNRIKLPGYTTNASGDSADYASGVDDEAAETQSLLQSASKDEQQVLTGWQLAGLYVTHSLSMWNNRSYEFGSVLFVSSAYPDGLTAASMRGLSANLASMIFSPAVGRWCNRYPSRLRTLQLSIVVQRICILIACLGWPLIVQAKGVDRQHRQPDERPTNKEPTQAIATDWMKPIILMTLILLGMVEKVSAVGNLIVMERDWVPLLATPSSEPPLHVLNASIKRIDLISKLVAPLAISGIALVSNSLRITALAIGGMQLVSVIPELHTARRVWQSSEYLQSPRSQQVSEPEILGDTNINPGLRNRMTDTTRTWLRSLRLFTSSPACVPSLCWAVQPFSVLTLSASMTVYLLAAHYPLSIISVARTLSTGVELCSTIIAPWLISLLYARYGDQTSFKPLFRVGEWGLLWQLTFLVPVVIILVILPSETMDPAHARPILTTLLFLLLSLSRLGPFAFGLVEQQLVQTIVPTSQRVEFSGVEVAITSFAELSRWFLTGVFGAPSQFKAVALGSLFLLAAATGVLKLWMRKWWDSSDHLRSQGQEAEQLAAP